MSSTWTERIHSRLKNAESGIPWWVNDKLKVSKFCSDNRLPAPKIIKIWDNPYDLNLEDTPREIVLKPNIMHSSRGVMLLTRGDDELFFDSMSQEKMTAEEVKNEQIKLFESSGAKNNYKIYIEEKINDVNPYHKIPLDYKVFCFYGVPRMVVQYDRNSSPKKTAFFDGNFRPLILDDCIETDWEDMVKGEHLLPASWREMLRISARASIRLKTPFIRVDLFNSSRGPLIGELTLTPGAAYFGKSYSFTPEFNEELGEEWELAILRLEADR